MRMLRVLVLLACVAVAIALMVSLVNAQEPKRLDETVALRLQLLATERALLEERAQRLAEAYAVKGREADAIMEAEAVRAGLSLQDGWRPDLTTKTWVKR